MNTARISVVLEGLEVTALVRMAEADCRQPREQLRFLLREEAQKRGLSLSRGSSQQESIEGDAHVDEAE